MPWWGPHSPVRNFGSTPLGRERGSGVTIPASSSHHFQPSPKCRSNAPQPRGVPPPSPGFRIDPTGRATLAGGHYTPFPILQKTGVLMALAIMPKNTFAAKFTRTEWKLLVAAEAVHLTLGRMDSVD